MIDLTSLDSVLSWVRGHPTELFMALGAYLGLVEGGVKVLKKGKVRHLELPVQIRLGAFRLWAVTLPPGIVLYSKDHMTPCIMAHEEHHIWQLRTWGPTAYTILHLVAAVLFFRRSRTNPLERRAYEIQDECEE